MQVFVLGRFPPPFDGQTILTRRLAELLDIAHDVRRVNTEPPQTGYVAAEVKFRPERVRHYLGLRRHIRQAFQVAPHAPVLWASVSPVPLGHWRDVLATLPAFQPEQQVFAVVHRGNFDRVFQSLSTTLTARHLVRRLSGFVFNNDQFAGACAPWIPTDKRFVIPNTIDEALHCTDAEVAHKRRERSGREVIRLLFLSNMIASKGYQDVLHAVRLLHEGGVPVRADFAGGWEAERDRQAFERFVDSAGLGDVVVHHGGVSDRAQIKALHLAADVFLLPSYYPTEAQPLAIIEALNAGTPVVTTQHSGIPYMVRADQEALFVPPRDPQAIAAAVQRLADDAFWLQLSEGARRRFQEHFSPETVRRQWEALIAQGAGGSGYGA